MLCVHMQATRDLLGEASFTVRHGLNKYETTINVYTVPLKDNTAFACFLLIEYYFELIVLLVVACMNSRTHVLYT